MTKPIVRIYTAVDKYIDREMNDTEFAQYETDQATDIIRQAAAEAAAAAEEAAKVAAQAKLTALGLTVEDLQALGL
jgi:hypothetical protein